ncbi:MAG: dTMP kinase, partial [Thermomicrobiales bacterium]
MRRGAFIAFEGIDGSGKSTQSRVLADRIQAAGQTVILTREPGGTPIGEAIRSLLFDRQLGDFEPRTEALLHGAARAQHVAQVIAPGIERGDVVITDRFIDSTLAYQGGGNHLSLVDLESIQAFAVQDTFPDLRIL